MEILNTKFAILYRNVIYYTKLLEFLGPQYEQAKIEETKDVSTIKVIRPEKRYSPRQVIIVIFTSIISSFLVVIGILIFKGIKKSYLNTTNLWSSCFVKLNYLNYIFHLYLNLYY